MLLVYSLCVIIGGLIASCVYIQLKQNKLILKTKGIPLVDKRQHYPIIGCTHKLLAKSTDAMYNWIMNLSIATSANIFKIFLFNKIFIVVKKPEYIQKILSSPHFLDKASPYSILPFQNSLFTSKSSMWKTHRKMLNQSFHIALIHKRFIQQFNKVSQLLIEDLYCKIGTDVFDFKPFISLRSTHLQLKSLFDADIGNDRLHNLNANLNKLQNIMADDMFKVIKRLVLSKIEGKPKIDKEIRGFIDKCLKFTQPYFDNAKEQHSQNIQDNNHISEENIKIRLEIVVHRLAQMLEEGYISDQTAQDHILFFLIAGQDTMTVAVSNCILCLAMNKDIQNKCANEIVDVIGDQFESINIEDLLKLQLLDRTINESLRLIPSASLIARTCHEDFQLDDTKIIPTGTDLLIPIFAIHRCEEYWGNNPTKFNPDNFLPENVANRPQLSFLPFSYGPRNCIAKKYAQYAIKIYVAHLLAKYKFSTYLTFEELKFGFNITTALKNKCMIRIEQR